MSFKVFVSENFKKEAKRLVKKYPSLKIELSFLFEELENYPQLGIPLGNNVYKIRLAISSKGKGKSGGARIITYLQFEEEIVLLLSIYDKGEKSNITESVVELIIKNLLE